MQHTCRPLLSKITKADMVETKNANQGQMRRKSYRKHAASTRRVYRSPMTIAAKRLSKQRAAEIVSGPKNSKWSTTFFLKPEPPKKSDFIYLE
jgi:hypothetical protein